MENESKTGMKLTQKKILWIAFALLIIIGGVFIFQAYSKQQPATNQSQTVSGSDHIASYISVVISAIADYKRSTEEADLVAQEYKDKGFDPSDQNIKTAENLAILKMVSSDFKSGNARLTQYLNDTNPIISLSAQVINKSTLPIIQASEDMQRAFHEGNVQKQQEALAAATVAQNDGENNILEVMGIIREGLIMGLGQNDKLSTMHGSIKHLLSTEQRNQLLAQIKSDFPDGTNKYSHDIFGLMVYGIQAALVSEMFDQFHSIAGLMTTNGAPALPFVVSQN